jgi:hypothetical protein
VSLVCSETGDQVNLQIALESIDERFRVPRRQGSFPARSILCDDLISICTHDLNRFASRYASDGVVEFQDVPLPIISKIIFLCLCPVQRNVMFHMKTLTEFTPAFQFAAYRSVDLPNLIVRRCNNEHVARLPLQIRFAFGFKICLLYRTSAIWPSHFTERSHRFKSV